MQIAAESLGLPVLQPDTVNSESFRESIVPLDVDLLVVCDYGQILSRETLAIAPLGGINLAMMTACGHASSFPCRNQLHVLR